MPHDTATALANPYLTAAVHSGGVGNSFDLNDSRPRATAVEARGRLVREFAWAIPNQRALAVIASLGPIVEIGAGGGYWARMLRDLGVDVAAYDPVAPDPDRRMLSWAWTAWTDVDPGGPEKAGEHPDRTLMLCWPDGFANTMASEALDAYRGACLIYIGEESGGNTADDAFFAALDRDWQLAHRVPIPQWYGMHDDLTVWTRRPA